MCDCCDGSDEWAGDIQCSNSCEARAARLVAEQRALAEGHRVRDEYVAAGRQARAAGKSPEDQLNWGPDDAFFKLSGACFDKKQAEYTYELCFFKSMEQRGTVLACVPRRAA